MDRPCGGIIPYTQQDTDREVYQGILPFGISCAFGLSFLLQRRHSNYAYDQ